MSVSSNDVNTFVIDPQGVLRYSDVRPVGLIRPKDDAIIAAIKEYSNG